MGGLRKCSGLPGNTDFSFPFRAEIVTLISSLSPSFLNSVPKMGMTIFPYKIQGHTILDYETLERTLSLGVRRER